MIRPLPSSYLAILASLAQRGPSVAGDLGVGPDDRSTMLRLMARGLIQRGPRVAKGRQTCFLYELTEEGRLAVASGAIALPAPTFNRTAPATVASGPCRHHWLIESTVGQAGRCCKCGERKSFGMTFRAKVTA